MGDDRREHAVGDGSASRSIVLPVRDP